jgi:hypothetical protein
LLPRHPPNALLALDLIQKKTGYLPKGREAGNNSLFIRTKSITFPALSSGSGIAEVIGPMPGRKNYCQAF